MKATTFSQIAIFVAGFLTCYFLLNNCNRQRANNATSKVEVVPAIINSGQITSTPETTRVEVPVISWKESEPVVIFKDTSFPVTLYKEADTLSIISRVLEDLYSVASYSDTLKLKYGTVIVNDTVTRNRIAGRSYSESQVIPAVTATFTQERGALLLGASLYSSTHAAVEAVAPSLMLQLKNKKAIEAGALLQPGKEPTYFLSYKIPILK